MQLTKAKVYLYNILPDWAFKLASRSYHAILALLSRASKRGASRQALYLKIAKRSLSTADRAALCRSGHSDLVAWNQAFDHFEAPSPRGHIDLAWVHKPVGGNFGDWLSPYLIRKAGGCSVRHLDLAAARGRPHVISLGSIITYANRHSTIVGSGINSLKDSIDSAARFLMVRGHITREALPSVVRTSNMLCCDPGFFVRNVYRPKEDLEYHGASLLIPHVNHWDLFASIEDEDFRILSAAACRPEELEKLIDRIAGAGAVVTSAMHIFVICCAFGVPCSLIKPKTAPIPVSGDGIKYRDCMSPVMKEEFSPLSVDIRPNMRILDEVGIQKYSIDYPYIDDAFNKFQDIVASVRSS